MISKPKIAPECEQADIKFNMGVKKRRERSCLSTKIKMPRLSISKGAVRTGFQACSLYVAITKLLRLYSIFLICLFAGLFV